MLDHLRRIYALAAFTVERRAGGWFYRTTYADDVWHGPYASEASVCLMLARALRRELVRRDGLPS